jgi:hypothetical protein
MSKIILRILAQLTFGWDTVIAFGVYVIMSFAFQETFNLWFLAWSIFFAYAPDLDFIYFVFQSKDIKKWGHWRLGFHHPLFFIPLFGILGWVISNIHYPGHEFYLTTLAIFCVFGHYIHDSTRDGLHWFSPITRDWKISFNALEWLNVRVTYNSLHILSREEVETRYKHTAQKSLSGGTINEIATRIEPVTKAQLIGSMFALIGLMILFWQ